MIHVEPFDRLLTADDFVVAMAPTQAEKIVEQCFGENAKFVAIGIDPERAMALGKLGAVLPVNERDMAIGRLGPIHRADDAQLAEGVVEMIVTTDDVRDTHVMIVDHHGKHVGRRSVGAKDHKIVDLLIGDADFTLDEILDDGFAIARGLEADDVGLALLVGARRPIAPLTVDAEGLALGLRFLTASLQLLRGEIAAIGMSRSE